MAEDAGHAGLAEEDRLRVEWYRLLGRLLSAPPDAETLKLLRGLAGDQSDLGRAIASLAAAAREADPAELEQEYFDLFIGVGQGELAPYGSYYLTGFLNEKPLARLRQDMRRLGIARAEEVKEPEDHIASLCEMMAGLADGAFGEAQDLDIQRRFFATHLAPWALRFFEDLEAAETARFYAPVGTIGRLFLRIETEAFEMAA